MGKDTIRYVKKRLEKAIAWKGMCPGTSNTRSLGADLLAPLLRCLLVCFGLLGSVQGILLVQFQHLHLFLDGIHGGGGLRRVPRELQPKSEQGKRRESPDTNPSRGPGERWGQRVRDGRRWSAGGGRGAPH